MSLREDFLKIDRATGRLLTATEKRIAREYAGLLKELRGAIGDQFAKHAKEGKLTFEQMAKYNRMEKLEKILAKAVQSRTVAIAGHVRGGLKDVLAKSFIAAKKTIEVRASIAIKGILKPETIQAALQNPISGLTLNRRLQSRRADIVLRIQETITQGLVRGETYADMAARLKEELEDDYVKAARIVRTEGHRVQEQGKIESLDYASKQGVKMVKRWLSSQDERVRDSHAHMDGVTVDYEEDFFNPETGGTGPGPGLMGTAEDDINCRCIFVVEVVKA